MERLEPVLATRDLTIGHAGRPLLRGIDLRLDAGQVLALLGPNGAGKTTLFRTLMGLIPAIEGAVTLAGQPLARLSRARIAAQLAYVPQSLATPFSFTALDVVLMGASVALGPFDRPGPAETRRAMAALGGLGIADLAEADITRLSGGQRQLILIARALAQQARVIVLDEPTASLDFANRLQVSRAIRQLAETGTAVILSSHDPDHAAALSDKVLLINRSGVVASGPTPDTLTEANMSRLYGIPVRRAQTETGGLRFF